MHTYTYRYIYTVTLVTNFVEIGLDCELKNKTK